MAEDQQLRSRAVQLLNDAKLASRFPSPLNVRTEVTFISEENGQSAGSGTYTRIRHVNGDLRQDAEFRDFRASMIEKEDEAASLGPWEDPPLAVRLVKEFVPYTPLSFDQTDVIQTIRDGVSSGQAATCIDFVTIRGQDHNPGEVCVSKANGTVLEWHDSRRAWTATAYTEVAGALVPSTFVYQEGNSILVKAEVRLVLLDSASSPELTVPASWDKANFCSTFQRPIAKATPQPETFTTAESAVVNVHVHAHVTEQGTLAGVEIIRSDRADLNEETLRVVRSWLYQPANCNGKPIAVPIDVTVHFQGR